jgi:hypothetical protein
MTQSSPRGRRTPAPATTTATRGVIVVVVAAFIGFILLLKGGGGAAEGAPAADLPKVTATPTTVTPTSSSPPSTEVPAAQLRVLVANGTQTKGLAAKTAVPLKSKGFPLVTTADATQQATTSQVYFVAGSEGDAKAVAAALGLPSARVAPMPATPPVASLGSNKVLVLLGPDAPGAVVATTTTIAATTTTAKPA